MRCGFEGRRHETFLENFSGIGYNLDGVEWMSRRQRKMSVQSISQLSWWVASDSLWSHGPQHTRLPCVNNSWSLLKLTSIESMMPSNHLLFCRSFLLLASVFPSIRVFSNESVLSIRWPKYWSFSFSISPSNEYSGMISLRIDWLDLLAVQESLKSLLQYHISKASILRHSAFFTVHLSHPYRTTEKKHSFN